MGGALEVIAKVRDGAACLCGRCVGDGGAHAIGGGRSFELLAPVGCCRCDSLPFLKLSVSRSDRNARPAF